MTKRHHHPVTFDEHRIALAHRGYTPPDRVTLWNMSRGRCFWCDGTMAMAGDPNASDYLTVDHVVPRPVEVRALRQLKVAACRRCNTERANSSADDYFALWSARLTSAHPRIFPRRQSPVESIDISQHGSSPLSQISTGEES